MSEETKVDGTVGEVAKDEAQEEVQTVETPVISGGTESPPSGPIPKKGQRVKEPWMGIPVTRRRADFRRNTVR